MYFILFLVKRWFEYESFNLTFNKNYTKTKFILNYEKKPINRLEQSNNFAPK